MESLHIDELEIDEERYQAWKTALNEKREAKIVSRSEQHQNYQTPRNPQHFFDDASKRRADAHASVHVEACTTDEIFKHIDEMLEAS